MQKANVATIMHARLEVITECPLNSGWSNEGMTPGGGDAAAISSRGLTATRGRYSENMMFVSMYGTGHSDSCFM